MRIGGKNPNLKGRIKMKNGLVNLNISEDIVRPIIEKQIQAAVLANIGDPEETIGKLVSLALKQKVNSEGYVSKYDCENRYDFLEVMTGAAIREAAKEALKKWLSDNAELMKKKVIEELNKPERRESIVGAFADAVERSFKFQWNFGCNINFTKQD